MPQTLFDKIWTEHVVLERQGMTLLHIDRHILHDLSSPPAYDMLNATGRRARNPELALATIDHMIPTQPGRTAESYAPSASFVRAPRSCTGTPHASNSRAISPPMPTPRLKRPFDATSRAAPSLANNAGG